MFFAFKKLFSLLVGLITLSVAINALMPKNVTLGCSKKVNGTNIHGIKIKNKIRKKDVRKYKYFMYHSPAEFEVSVNGKKLSESEEISVKDRKLKVAYSYTWRSPFGTVSKIKNIEYDIDEKTKEVDLSFTSWDKDEPRIKAPGCSFKKVAEIERCNTMDKKYMKS